MVRKQFYLEDEQAEALERRAKETGEGQAEIVRRALERYLAHGDVDERRRAAWARIIESMEAVSARATGATRERTWTRDELYER
jgi:hypothetical protein